MLPKPESKGDFLKAHMLAPLLKKGRATATVQGEPAMGKYGVDVSIQIGKQPFVMTLDPRGRDYRLVTDTLGLNADEWEGATFVLGIRDGTNKKGEPTQYVNVLEVEEA